MEETKKQYAVVVNETVAGSIIKDIASFAMFAGLMLFNHQYLNGSTLIDVIFILLIFLLLAARSSKSVFRGTTQEAIEWLKEK